MTDVTIRSRGAATYVEDVFGTQIREFAEKLTAGEIITVPHVALEGEYKDLVGIITTAAQAFGYTLIFVRGDDQAVDFLVKKSVG